MKKIIPVLLMIILLVSACNFPEDQDLSQDPVVQTRVAEILTQGAPFDIFPEETPEAQDDVIATMPATTEGKDGATSVPVEDQTALPATEEPSQETPVPVEPTSTPVEAAPGDPWEGTPDFIEEFNSGTYWDFEGDHLLSKVANGKLEFTSKGTPWWSSWYTTYPAQKNGYFETTFTMPNCAGADRFGLVIRWGEGNQFYYLGVTCDGSWGFSLYTTANQTIDLLPYSKTDALNPAAQTNRIGILAKDSSFDFYINGELVGSTTHDGLKEAGSFGFITMSTGTKDFQTLIEKLEFWSK